MLKIHKPKSKEKNETQFVQEEEGDQAEFPLELFQLMQARDNLELEDRGILFINNVITKHTLDRAYKRLLSLHFNPNFTDTIQIIINSPGGYTDAGWAFIDMMEFVKNPITTIAVGEIASMATSIFIAGDQRVMSPNSIAMIHEFSTGTAGNYSELVASRKAEDIEYQKDLNHLIRHSRYTTQAQITANLLKETDNWLTPVEMSFHGLCDEITEARPRQKKRNAKKKTTKRKTK
jgi:ATP-dependent Clp protease, protease subunit